MGSEMSPEFDSYAWWREETWQQWQRIGARFLKTTVAGALLGAAAAFGGTTSSVAACAAHWALISAGSRVVCNALFDPVGCFFQVVFWVDVFRNKVGTAEGTPSEILRDR